VEPGLVVHGDPGLLRILCDNLLGNAWKYSAKTDCTEITVRRDIRSGSAGILFRDRGAGFDRARASRLFTPFQRYHQTEEFAGTGVGLATVQRIVNRHGGAISAESAPGHGAEFFLVLPGPEQPRRSPLTSTPT
jgi:signal transduction histidine kinase